MLSVYDQADPKRALDGVHSSQNAAERIKEQERALLKTPLKPLPKGARHTDFDLRQFFQLNADGTLEETPYEGETVGNYATKLFELMQKAANLYGKPTGFDEAQKLLADLCDKSLNSCRTHEGVLTYAREVRTKIASLAIGKKLALPGGFLAQGGGHATVYIVEKTGATTYNFSVHNTGHGISFHPSVTAGLKDKVIPVITFEDATLDGEFSETFLYSIFYINAPIKKETFSKEAPYHLLFDNFSQCRRKTDFSYDDLITAQLSGTCALKAPLAMIYDLVPREFYKFLVFYAAFESCHASLSGKYDAELSGGKQLDVEARALARTAARNLLHKGLKLHKKGTPLGEFYQDAIDVSRRLLAKIDVLEEEAKKRMSRRQVAMTNPRESTCPASKTSSSPIVKVPDSDEHERVLPPVIKPTYRSQQDIVVEVINQQISNQYFSRPLQRNQIEAFVDAMPIPTGRGEAFWRCSSKERAEELAITITSMMSHYTYGLNGAVYTAKQRNTTHAMFAIIHFLISQYDRDIAELYGLGGLVSEKDPTQLFLSVKDYGKHNEILGYEQAALSSEAEYSWGGQLTSFDPSQLPPLLRKFWSLFQPHSAKIMASVKSEMEQRVKDGRTVSEEWRKSPKLYCFLEAFKKYSARDDDVMLVSQPFRTMQHAYALLVSLEKSTSSYDYREFNVEYQGDGFTFSLYGVYPQNTTLSTISGHLEDRKLKRSERRDDSEAYPIEEIEREDRQYYPVKFPTTSSFTHTFFRHALGKETLRPIDLFNFGSQFFGALEKLEHA